jgi:hypothetical protein
MQNAASIGMPPEFGLYVMGISAGACLAASIVIRERMVSQGKQLLSRYLSANDGLSNLVGRVFHQRTMFSCSMALLA